MSNLDNFEYQKDAGGLIKIFFYPRPKEES